MTNLKLFIQKTMSSREIAELTGKQHKNVLVDCDKLNEIYGKIGLAEISADLYLDAHKRQQREYLLSKMQTMDLMTGYNLELRIKVNRRWEELETKNTTIDFSNPDTVLMLAQNWKDEREKRIQAENVAAQKDELIEIQHVTINDLAPKAAYTDKVLTSKDTYTATQIAKEFGYAARTLNNKLRSLRVQYKHGGQWLLYAKYQNKGYTKTNTHSETIGGETRTWHTTVWTEKGRSFLHSILSA